MSDTRFTATEPELADLLAAATQHFGQGVSDVPAKVIAYNATLQVADVQPVVMKSTAEGLKSFPILRDVQVLWPSGSTWSLVGDLVAGDLGWLQYSGHDFSAWKMRGVEADPLALRRDGGISDCVFVPGGRPLNAALGSDAFAAASLVIKAAMILLGSSAAAKAVALNSDNCPATAAMAKWMGEVEIAINGLAPGSITVLSTAFAPTAIATVTASAGKVKAE